MPVNGIDAFDILMTIGFFVGIGLLNECRRLLTRLVTLAEWQRDKTLRSRASRRVRSPGKH